MSLPLALIVMAGALGQEAAAPVVADGVVTNGVVANGAIPGGTIARGTIAVVAASPDGKAPAPPAAFANGVESALTDAGFTVIPDREHARYAAMIALSRRVDGAAVAKGGGTGIVAGGPAIGGTGAGVAVGLGSSTAVRGMMATELTLTITRRGDAAPAWQGRAVTYQVGGTRADDPAALAAKLTAALARNLDRPSGLVVSVP